MDVTILKDFAEEVDWLDKPSGMCTQAIRNSTPVLCMECGGGGERDCDSWVMVELGINVEEVDMQMM